MRASWRYTAEEQIQRLRHSNEDINAFVACGGRMELYSYLDRLGERALYCDKDSVLFVKKESNPPLIEYGVAL